MAASIIVNKVGKRYRIGKGITSLKELFGPSKRASLKNYHWAVKDLSFSLEPGDALGIIGPNGAGKTTILKMLSKVTKPTTGEIRVNGRLSALIELGAGFHPDLTGRENIFLNGTILGMHITEIKSRFDKIVDFAGIGEYLDTPVKRYSSGMYARLGFAIAAHMDPQVLLVDEVLAVGDYAFQIKCYHRMDELRSNGTALIFVSHNLEVVRQVCNSGLVMYRGEAIFRGNSGEAVAAYSEALRKAAREAQAEVPKEDGLNQRVLTFDAEVVKASLLDPQDHPVTVLESGAKARIVIDVHFNKSVCQPIFAFTIRTPDGRLIYNITTHWMGITTPDFKAGEDCQVEFSVILPLLEGNYELGVDITPSDLTHYFDRLENALDFFVKGTTNAIGVVDMKAVVDFKKECGKDLSQMSLKVSVIIPTYNQAQFLSQSINSVLKQSYQNLEVIVVDDASTDNTNEIMQQFSDPRVKYIAHEKNRYCGAARNSGIKIAQGELFAFLDADDYYHPDKLEIIVRFLEENPDVGLAYNSRIEVDESGLPLNISHPPTITTLNEQVLGYPYSPSEIVIRKEWFFQVGTFDESFTVHGEDPDFNMRLSLAGCLLRGVDRCLNFRRLHAGRPFRNLPGVIEGETRAYENVFSDPRCPVDVLALRNKSLALLNLDLAYFAFVQRETEIGRNLIQKAVAFNPFYIDSRNNELLRFLNLTSIQDGGDHEFNLRKIFSQLPTNLEMLKKFEDHSIAYGYLMRGARDLIWGRVEPGLKHCLRAKSLNVRVDAPFLSHITDQLIWLDSEFGEKVAQEGLVNLTRSINELGSLADIRWINGCFTINKAFRSYSKGDYSKVKMNTLRGLYYQPSYFFNRGVLKILINSILHQS